MRNFIERRSAVAELAFWNAQHDERGFASMHIYRVASGKPVVTILRPARTPKGTEVRTVIKHVTKRRRHWPKTRIVWRGGRTTTTTSSASTAMPYSRPWWWRRRRQSALLSCDE
jgi:hypothetical protein